MSAKPFKPKRVVVYAVGLEKYHSRPTGQIPEVRYAVADAQAFVAAMRDLWSGKVDVFEEDILTDAEASLTRISDDLRWKIRNLDADDLFVVYYAGHGVPGVGGNRITAADTNIAHLETTTALIREIITDPLEESACEHSMLFIDACAADLQDGFGTRDVVTSMTAADYKSFLDASEYSAVFLSCKPKEKSFSCHKLKHGVWTWHLVQALLGKADNAIDAQRWVTDASLRTYLTASVSKYVRDVMAMTSAQTPQARITATGNFPIRHVPVPTLPPLPTDLSGFLLTPKTTALMSETSGAIRSLPGYKPAKHVVPKKHTAAASSFVSGLLAGDVETEGRDALAAVQAATRLRLAEIELIEESAVYELRAARFAFVISGDQDSDDPSQWSVQTRLELNADWDALADELDEAFGNSFNIVEVAIERPDASLSELADQMEDLKETFGGTVTIEGQVAAYTGEMLGFQIDLSRMTARLRLNRKYSLQGALEEARRWHMALSV